MGDHQEIVVSPRTLEDSLRQARSYTRRYQLTNSVDEKTNHKGLELLTKFLQVYIGTRRTVGANGFFESSKDLNGRERFLDSYSAYVASVETLEYGIQRFSEFKPIRRDSDIIDFDHCYSNLDTRIDLVVSNIMEKLGKFTKGLTGDYFLNSTVSFLEFLVGETKRNQDLIEDNNGLILESKKLKVIINESEYDGINGYVLRSVFENLPEINKNQFDSGVRYTSIVGNQEAKQGLRRAVENVLTYDSSTRTNLLNEIGFPSNYLLIGRPGTGKTSLIKATLNYADEISERAGIPFEYIHLDSSSFKSKYFSESALNLRKVLGKVYTGDKVYLVALEDFDTVFFSREDDHVSSENKAILGVMLDVMEGVNSVNLGNVMYVATSNVIRSCDSALVERLFQSPFYCNGPETLEEYCSILGVHFNDNLRGNLDVDDGQWNHIAGYCKENGFSGRDVRNISRIIGGKLLDFDKSIEWFPGGLDISKYVKRIDFSKLMSSIRQYQEHREVV